MAEGRSGYRQASPARDQKAHSLARRKFAEAVQKPVDTLFSNKLHCSGNIAGTRAAALFDHVAGHIDSHDSNRPILPLKPPGYSASGVGLKAPANILANGPVGSPRDNGVRAIEPV